MKLCSFHVLIHTRNDSTESAQEPVEAPEDLFRAVRQAWRGAAVRVASLAGHFQVMDPSPGAGHFSKQGHGQPAPFSVMCN